MTPANAAAPTTIVTSASFSNDTGISNSDLITNVAAQTISGTLNAELVAGEFVEVSLDNGSTWATATIRTGSANWTLAGVTLSGSSTMQARVVNSDGAGATAAFAYVLDTTPPSISSVTVPADGTYITGDTLDFTVTFHGPVSLIFPASTRNPSIALVIGSTTRYATLTSTIGFNQFVFRYTITSADQDNDGITIYSQLNLNGNAITDLAGNPANLTLYSVGSTAGIHVNNPQSTTISVSSPASDGTYGIGASIPITVQFDQPVTVDTRAGTPQLALNSGGRAFYMSGTGTSTLTFNYIVSAGENSADLDYASTTALSLNGATISQATLTLPAPGSAGSLGANKALVIDTRPSTITFSQLALSSDTGASATDFITKTANQTISATLSQALASGDKVLGSLDNGASFIDITSHVTGTQLQWAGALLNAGVDGSNTLQLKILNAVGAATTPFTQNYVLDTTPPATPTVNVLSTKSLTPALTGSAILNSGETLTVSVGGASYQVVPAAGAWSLDLTAAEPSSGTLTLSAGKSYNVVARAVDLAGNTATDATSNELTITITPVSSSITLTSTPNPSKPGEAVTITAKVVASTSAQTSKAAKAAPTVPTGNMNFTDNGTPIGTVALDVNGVASLTVQSLTKEGVHTLVASYSGDTYFAAASSSALTQTVEPPVTPPVAATPVPTLGQWALMLLSLLLMAAIVFVRRPNSMR